MQNPQVTVILQLLTLIRDDESRSFATRDAAQKVMDAILVLDEEFEKDKARRS